MQRHCFPVIIRLAALLNVRLHCGCGCSVPLPIVHVFLGGAQNCYPLVLPCALCDKCKVLAVTICQPLEGLDCRLVYCSAEYLLKYPIELFVIISEEDECVKVGGLALLLLTPPEVSMGGSVQEWNGA